MNAKLLISAASLTLVACGPSAAPIAEAPVEPAPQPEEQAEDDVVYQPSQEELDAEKLAQDRAKMQGEAQVELRRFTPELREKTKKLTDTKYKDLEAALAATLVSEHRRPDSKDRDAARHPAETLEFFGLTPKSRVLEYGPGAGWYTEILAPVVAAEGKLFVTTADPDGPKESRQTYYGERTKLFLNKSPEAYGKVQAVIIDPQAPKLTLEEPVDLALIIRGVHGMVLQDSLGSWLDQIQATLTDGGVLGIVQHRAKADADPKKSAANGYIPEAWLIDQVEAHGFKLVDKSEINANPKDTTDHPEGVWTLPPTLRLGETDRQKYVDIGESDRMTLRFEKAAAK